jgi:uncharacterized protein
MMEFFKKIIFYLIGIIIVSLGISLTITANFGVGSWDALNVALSETVGLTVGSWIFIIGFILIFVNSVIEKKKPAYLEIVAVAIIGSCVDFWLLFVLDGISPESTYMKIGLLLIGILILSFGISIYLQPKFPVSPIDHLMVAISERFGISYTIAKTSTELFAIIMALIMKGPIGIGTLIIAATIGPMIQLFFPFTKKWYERLINVRTSS